MTKISQLILTNFTAFKLFKSKFSAGVNVFIGPNGTGKTHLLKVLYAACAVTQGEDKERPFALKLRNVFSPYMGSLGRLSNRQNKSTTTRIQVFQENGTALGLSFSNHTTNWEQAKPSGLAWKRSFPLNSAYIPVKEMLAHAPGFLSLASKREIAFEEVYSDIIKKSYLPKLLGPPDKDRSKLLKTIQKAIEGKVIVKGEHFFLKNKQGELEFALLAEGVRKLALIWVLIQNGTLLNGSILFWDEPEANLNPSLMGEVVEIILELQRIGVQVFLTTHNYIVLKELALRRTTEDSIRYFSLFRTEEGEVDVHSTESYDDIDPNAISDTFSSLYSRDLLSSLKSLPQ